MKKNILMLIGSLKNNFANKYFDLNYVVFALFSTPQTNLAAFV